MYFNKNHERTGSLFQGRFQAQHANTDEYLKYLMAYVHLNPVKLIEPNWKVDGVANMSKVKKYLAEYKYSSYADYMGDDRIEKMILNQSALPEYFPAKSDFETYLEDWLTYTQSKT
jgi:putative transposase